MADTRLRTHVERPIAVFIPHLHIGGAEKVALNLSMALADLGNRVDLVAANATGSFAKQVGDTLNLVDLKSPRISRSVRALRTYIQEEKPVAVIAHLSRSNIVLLLALVGLANPPKAILVEHATPHPPKGLKDFVLQRLMRLLYHRADAVVAASEGNARDIEKLTGLPPQSVCRIYNPIVSDGIRVLAREAPEHPWTQDNDIPLLVTLGRLSKEKDHDTLIRALALLSSRRPCRLLIMGPGPLKEPLQALIEELGLESTVELAGFVDNPYAILGSASLFVLSSWTEALPTALIEALACGTQVVSTDCKQGPREILMDGALGPLAPVGDPEGLAKAIEFALDNPVPREKLLDRSDDFTFAKSAGSYLELIKS